MATTTARPLCVLALAICVALFADTAKADEGPFSNASLHGTYTYVSLFSDAGEPFPNGAIVGLVYFDGNGG